MWNVDVMGATVQMAAYVYGWQPKPVVLSLFPNGADLLTTMWNVDVVDVTVQMESVEGSQSKMISDGRRKTKRYV